MNTATQRTKTVSVEERLARLELLRDPSARLEDMAAQQRVYNTAFSNYCKYGVTSNALKREPESAGGYLVPDEMERRIMDTLNQRNVMRQICNVIQTTQDMKIPVVAAHGQAFWVPEGGRLPVSDDQFNRVVIGAYKLGASQILSSELLEDSIIDMEALIADSLARRIADAEEDAFLNGDGNGKPIGLLTQADVGATTRTAGVLSLDDVIDLTHSVRDAYRSKAVLLMNDATLRTLFKIKDAYGRSVWHGDLEHGVMDRLLDYPIVISDAMPDPVSGNKPIAFGDFSHFWIGDRGRHHVKRLNELHAKTDQVEIILTKRVDAKLLIPEAIRTLLVA